MAFSWASYWIFMESCSPFRAVFSCSILAFRSDISLSLAPISSIFLFSASESASFFSASHWDCFAFSREISTSFSEMVSSLASSAFLTAMLFSSSNLSILAMRLAISASLSLISLVNCSLVLVRSSDWAFSTSAFARDMASFFSCS